MKNYQYIHTVTTIIDVQRVNTDIVKFFNVIIMSLTIIMREADLSDIDMTIILSLLKRFKCH